MNPDTPLRDVKRYLRENAEDGVHCPACNKMVKIYRRKVHASMAASLITLCRYRPEWVELANVLPHRQIADAAKLKYWKLIEEHPDMRAAPGKAGLWRATSWGEAFARGEARIRKYALVYNRSLLEFTEDEVSIRECLGDKFDFDDLWHGR